MEMKKKIQLLQDTLKIFKDNNIKFFIIHGTLLGFIREKRIIPWDEDVDFGAWYQDYDKILNLEKDFKKLGYKYILGSGKYSHLNIIFDDKHEDSKPELYHIGIDFWIEDKNKAVLLKFFDENIFNKYLSGVRNRIKNHNYKKLSKIFSLFNKIFNNIILYTRKHEVYPINWFKNLTTIKVYNMDFMTPSDYEGYLTLTYGSNWRIPDKNWSYTKWMKVHKAFFRYKIKDKNLRNLWILREDTGDKP